MLFQHLGRLPTPNAYVADLSLRPYSQLPLRFVMDAVQIPVIEKTERDYSRKAEL